MNPEWLRYFVTLSETLNFHAAAERLYLTPQALSKAVASLEDQPESCCWSGIAASRA